MCQTKEDRQKPSTSRKYGIYRLWEAAIRFAVERKKGFQGNRPVPALTKALLLISLIVIGLVAQHYGWIDTQGLLENLEAEGSRWLPVVTIAVMIPLYTFALPAAPLMALCGVLFHPLPATIIVFTGGVTGSILAYFLSGQLARNGIQEPPQKPGLVKRMRENTTFASLFALRICPGMPHAAINYTAGALQIPLHLFISSTAAGFVAKGVVYTTAVHRATQIDEKTDIWSWYALWPLIALLALALAGIVIERHVTRFKQTKSLP